MGGIAGELRFDRRLSDPSITRAMCDDQIHRGPEGEGYYSKGSLSLGMRCLATTTTILEKGVWPLCNENDTIHLVLDGEIYGSHTLRLELEQLGHRFSSRMDAETIVHGYEEWGTRCLEKISGMYAFSLWDEPRELLWLARDRFGIKPLCYAQNRNFFAFASEMKPLLGHPDVSAEPNEAVISNYLQRGLVGIREETFFAGINRVLPASYLLIGSDGVIEKRRYWRPMISRNLSSSISARTVETTRNLFLDAVREQLVSDLTVGASLSGGIDSSSVVCAMRRIGPTGPRIQTFSASFPGDPIDETEYVRTVCDATEADNHAIILTADDFWRDLPVVIRCQEEPFDLSFVYAQWRLMKDASERDVRVMLEGHGPDELLCGYPLYYFYYFMTLIRQRKYHRLLIEVLRSQDLTKHEAMSLISTYFPTLGPFLTSLIARIPKNRDRISRQYRTSGQKNEFPQAPITDLAAKLEIDTALESIPMALRYVDKNATWHGIEVRVPFLQKAFVEHCTSLPLDQKIRDGWTKHALRLAMKDILPEEIRLRRSKIGFQMPVNRWIANELRQRLRGFFSDPNLKGTRYYNKETARNILSKRTLTARDIGTVWRMLSVELWCREFF
jgi:asparagine synthase (glutamine-hydrolysing)